MAVIATAVLLGTEGLPSASGGQSVLLPRPIERVASFHHAVLEASRWIVANCTIKGKLLVEQFPEKSHMFSEGIVAIIEEKFTLTETEELTLPFPAHVSSALVAAAKQCELDDIHWPACAGISVIRRDQRATVQLFPRSLAPAGSVILYQSRIAV